VDKFHDEDRTHDGEMQKERQKSVRPASEPKHRKAKDNSTNITDVKF